MRPGRFVSLMQTDLATLASKAECDIYWLKVSIEEVVSTLSKILMVIS